MKHALILIASLALAACAAPAETPTPTLAADLSCDASGAERCPPGGCPTGQAPEDNPVPISILVPANAATDLARFCIATGCEDARIDRVTVRDGVWRGVMTTNERTQMRMDMEISANRSAFTLRHATGDAINTWRGACNVAGS